MAKHSTSMNPLSFIRKYDELFNRLLFLLGALVVYRFGSHVPIPGMNPDSLANFFKPMKIPFWDFLICSQVVHWSGCL